MKKYLLLFLLLISLSGYSQIQYPHFETDSLGQATIVLTIEQAQALDNSTDLLSLFEKLNDLTTSYDEVVLKVINEKNEIIAKQEIQIKQLKVDLTLKDAIIANLKQTISKKDLIIANDEEQSKTDKSTIEANKKEIKSLKGKMIIGGSLGGLAIIGLLYIILL